MLQGFLAVGFFISPRLSTWPKCRADLVSALPPIHLLHILSTAMLPLDILDSALNVSLI